MRVYVIGLRSLNFASSRARCLGYLFLKSGLSRPRFFRGVNYLAETYRTRTAPAHDCPLAKVASFERRWRHQRQGAGRSGEEFHQAISRLRCEAYPVCFGLAITVLVLERLLFYCRYKELLNFHGHVAPFAEVSLSPPKVANVSIRYEERRWNEKISLLLTLKELKGTCLVVLSIT